MDVLLQTNIFYKGPFDKLKIMKNTFLLTLLFVILFHCSYGQKPVSDPTGPWQLLPNYSDEFSGTTLNSTLWDSNINNFGAWTWDPQNVYLLNGTMHIRMINEKNVSGADTFYFKSGAARQKLEITYGYFEARVKGCPKWPGVCPAFWMYSVNQPVTNGIKYNEVDFMEIQQRQYNLNIIDCNLHLERVVNGNVVRTDPQLQYTAPFSPNDGFHVYGCNVTPATISMYIDGVYVGSHVNDYYRLPMRVILSMGVRPPLMIYVNGVKTPIPIENEPGFPTEMEVDYVRVWTNTQTLPINILSFTGKAVQNTVRLNWATASETNNKLFEVLRSGDGVTFTKIGTLNGAGNSNVYREYSFTDDHPSDGENYYQLKQIDLNGRSTFSSIVPVQFKIVSGISSINVSYNSVRANIISSEIRVVKVALIDMYGRLLQEKHIALQKGDNPILFTQFLSSGAYVIRLFAQDMQVCKTFVK